MNGVLGTKVLWPFDKKFIFKLAFLQRTSRASKYWDYRSSYCIYAFLEFVKNFVTFVSYTYGMELYLEEFFRRIILTKLFDEIFWRFFFDDFFLTIFFDEIFLTIFIDQDWKIFRIGVPSILTLIRTLYYTVNILSHQKSKFGVGCDSNVHFIASANLSA